MKHINQINLALVVIAAAAAIYAFSQTYFAPTPDFVAPQSSLPQESQSEASPAAELEPVPSPRLPAPVNPAQNAPRTRSRGAEGFTAPQDPPTAPARTPQSGAAGGPRVITPRSANPAAARPRTPLRSPIAESGATSPRAGAEEEQELEAEPQNPPDLRRGPRRGGGASPPPAQSSSPDRRRP